MIIGISGKMRTGKSTTARLVAELLNHDHGVVSFGDAVKRECAELLDVPLGMFHDQDMKDEVVTVLPGVLHHFGQEGDETVEASLRKVMQWRGQTARRDEGGYWVYRLHQDIHGRGNLIIDDVRYPDEAFYVRSRGGVLIRLNPHPYWESGPNAGHESETALDDWADWDMELWPEFKMLDIEARKIAQFLKEKHES